MCARLINFSVFTVSQFIPAEEEMQLKTEPTLQSFVQFSNIYSKQ